MIVIGAVWLAIVADPLSGAFARGIRLTLELRAVPTTRSVTCVRKSLSGQHGARCGGHCSHRLVSEERHLQDEAGNDRKDQCREPV